MSVVMLVWLRLHKKPLRYWLGDVSAVTTPAGGINVITWTVRARGTEMTFDFAGATINVKFWMTSGNVRVLAEAVTPRVPLRLWPSWQTGGGFIGPWGTQRMTMIYIPLWWMPVPLLVAVWYFRRHACSITRLQVCSRCHYNLAGLAPRAPCPECGERSTPAASRS